jgi:hypothetical protein
MSPPAAQPQNESKEVVLAALVHLDRLVRGGQDMDHRQCDGHRSPEQQYQQK